MISLISRGARPVDPSDTPYGYIPTESASIVILVLFSTTTIVHLIQATYFRKWWLFPTVGLCGALETLGWAARVWSSISPTLRNPYLIQICVTILAPTPLLAANFVILRKIINRLGTSYSRLGPRSYATIFCSADFIALVVQGTGGGLAATAFTQEGARRGGHIALAGIAFQLAIISIFLMCTLEFFIRYSRDIPFKQAKSARATEKGKVVYRETRGQMDNRVSLLTVGLFVSTVCLFARAIYRTVELSGGWSGRIIQTEIYFIILDGMLVTIAMFTLNVAHPGLLISSSTSRVTSDDTLREVD